MLATEETKTVTHWRGTDGTAYTTKRWAEINSIADITGFVHDLEDVDAFLKKLVTHADTKAWLLQQLGEQPIEVGKSMDFTQEGLRLLLLSYPNVGDALAAKLAPSLYKVLSTVIKPAGQPVLPTLEQLEAIAISANAAHITGAVSLGEFFYTKLVEQGCQPAAQPQQEVYDGDYKLVMQDTHRAVDRYSSYVYNEAYGYGLRDAIKESGYKLVKA